MNRLLAFIFGGLAVAAGCDQASAPPAGNLAGPPGPPAAPGAPAAALPPVEKLEGFFTREQVEQMLREELKLVEISLQPVGAHDYTGSGKTVDRRQVMVTIKQVSGGIKIEHTDNFGGSGSYSWGNPVP